MPLVVDVCRCRYRFGAVIGGLLGVMLIGDGVGASPSDPIRNDDPEQPIPPDQIEKPIYYTMPVGNPEQMPGMTPEALLQAFMDSHSATNYPAAIEAALRLIEAVPDRAIGHYNLACALSRLQRLDEAFVALRDAITRGWRDMVHLSIDPDLASLRSDARYAEIVGDLKARIESERIAPAPLRSDDWQAVAADLSRDVPAMLARYHLPGASVALIRDGEVVWTSAFGRRDMRSDDLLAADDVFRLRSPLHLLAMAACEQLQRERKIELASLLVEAANEHGVTTIIEQPGVAIGERGSAQPARRQESGDNPAGARNGRSVAFNVRSPALCYSRRSVYGFLRLAIEEASEQPFPNYCTGVIFPAVGVRQSAFIAPDDAGVVAVGHSALGTPLRPSVLEDEFAPGGSVHMTAGDLARLIAAGLPADATQVPLDSPAPIFDPAPGGYAGAIDMVTQADAALAGSLGMSMRRLDTCHGVRMHMDESSSGIVLLARWHPQSRSGVVVLCNAATGRAAAERIAHTALGGE